MSHAFPRIPSPSTSVTKRILVAASLVAFGYLAALLAPTTVGAPGGVAFGTATPVKHFGTAVADRAAATTQRDAAAMELQRGFDYFPDHYANQATEVAEPIATF